MSKPFSVTLAYIDARPASAAADLSRLSHQEASLFLDSIPVRYAVKIIRFASSRSSAIMLSGHSPIKTISILRELPFPKATEILRLMKIEAREQVLEAAPRRLKQDFEISLSYPDDTVGASMTVETFAFQPEQLVRDVLAEIRSDIQNQSDLVFVVSHEHELLGVVDPLTLLRSQGDQRVADIMRTDAQSLSARSRLSSIADHEAWDSFTVLPVLSRRDHLVGALSKTTVTEKLDIGASHEPVRSPSLTTAVASSFIYAAIEFAKLLADGKPGRKHNSRNRATS